MTTPVTEALTVTLKPCPFCGAEFELVEGAWYHPIQPPECPGKVNGVRPTETSRITAWNTRHTTPTEPVLRWEGSELWLGEEPVAWVDTFKSGQAEWNCTLANFEDEAPTLPEARTAAEQAVRDWLARAGLVRQGGEVVFDPDEATGCADDRFPGTADDWRKFLPAHPPASPTAELVEALRRISELCPVTCDITLAHEMASIADEVLAKVKP